MRHVPGASRGRLLSAQQLAGVLGVSKRWIYGQVQENALPAYRLGRSLAFELEAVETWLEERRIGDWKSCAEKHEMVEFRVVKPPG